MSDEETVALAGEVALGTLGEGERAAAAARMASDPAFVREVRGWESRLAQLALRVPPVAPSEQVWPGIERRIGFAPVANDGGSPGFWRFGAVAASVTAAVLGSLLVLRQPAAPSGTATNAPVAGATTVAMLTEGGTSPGLLLTLDEKSGEVIAQPVNLSAPSGKSLELWSIVGAGAPRKVGLVSTSGAMRYRVDPAAAVAGAKFAISVEPPGGAPGDAPTGPVTFLGEAVRLPQKS